ncbi:hypothetical protein [uncultured Roseibium sp.]|uniref:hypothetical protein n=1 Tax=uncultured Roseibium sp. TaxID=1936171 RepID=UPI002608EE84|nr:hypothetical protein [uncultured Roseibium sp.]
MDWLGKIVCATALLIGTMCSANAVVINFDDLGSSFGVGELTGNEYAGSGVLFSTPDVALNLGTTVGSSPNSLGASTSAIGNGNFNGQLNVDFTGGLSYTDVSFLIFNTPFQASAFDIGGNLLTTLANSGGFSQIFDFSGFAVHRLEITGSNYAIDDFSFSTAAVNVIPIPAALPLLAGALGLMGAVGWRIKQKASASA